MFQNNKSPQTETKPVASRRDPEQDCYEIRARLTQRFPECSELGKIPTPDVTSCSWILDLINQRSKLNEPPTAPDKPPEADSPATTDRMERMIAFIRELSVNNTYGLSGWNGFIWDRNLLEISLGPFQPTNSNATGKSQPKTPPAECPAEGVPLIDYLIPKSQSKK